MTTLPDVMLGQFVTIYKSRCPHSGNLTQRRTTVMVNRVEPDELDPDYERAVSVKVEDPLSNDACDLLLKRDGTVLRMWPVEEQIGLWDTTIAWPDDVTPETISLDRADAIEAIAAAARRFDNSMVARVYAMLHTTKRVVVTGGQHEPGSYQTNRTTDPVYKG